jgi:hypothetical protein
LNCTVVARRPRSLYSLAPVAFDEDAAVYDQRHAKMLRQNSARRSIHLFGAKIVLPERVDARDEPGTSPGKGLC